MASAGGTRSTAKDRAGSGPSSRSCPQLLMPVAAHAESDLRHMVTAGSAAGRGDLLVHLQRTSGNRAVQSLVRSDVQRKKYKDSNVAHLAQSMPALDKVATRARNRIGRLVELEKNSRSAVAAVRGHLQAVSWRYNSAYENHMATINAANVSSQEQQEVVDVVCGLVIGVSVGLGVGAVAGVGAVVAQSFARSAGTELLGEAAAAALGKATEGVREVPGGGEIEGAELTPAILDGRLWKSVMELYEKAPLIGPVIAGQSELLEWVAYQIGENKAHMSGGDAADQTAEDNTYNVRGIMQEDKDQGTLDTAIDNALRAVVILKRAGDQEVLTRVKAIERYIWICWLAAVPKGSNILDHDLLESRLGQRGFGLVNYKHWHTTQKEMDDAIDRANSAYMKLVIRSAARNPT